MRSPKPTKDKRGLTIPMPRYTSKSFVKHEWHSNKLGSVVTALKEPLRSQPLYSPNLNCTSTVARIIYTSDQTA